MEDRHKYHWIHKEAKDIGPFLSVYRLYECPVCGLTFHSLPRS